MRRGLTRAVTIVAALAITSVAAAKNCKPIAGDFSAGPAAACPSVFCTQGVLTGDLEGTYFFVATAPTPTGGLLGQSTITLRKGELNGSDVSELGAPNAEGLIPFTTTVTIVGGSGKYTGASGELVATGLLDPVAGTTVGGYTGTLCKD